MRRKRSITLMEMMIVISLIAVALGAMSLPISKALKSETFAHGVDGVIGKIMLAQEVMLDFNTDLQLFLKKDEEGKGIHCHIVPGIPLPPHIEKGLNHRPLIPGITEMAFNHEIKNSIQLSFEGPIGSISQGTLTLGASGKEEHIALPGYPKHIRRGNYVQTTSSTPYPEEIISAL